MATATWNGQVLAESDDTVVVEGNHYFPIESIRGEHFEPARIAHDNMCECCRLGVLLAAPHSPAVVLRNIFDGERDHALLQSVPHDIVVEATGNPEIGARIAVDATVGDGVHPQPGLDVDGVQAAQGASGQEVGLHIPYGPFDASLFMRRQWVAGPGSKAVVAGEVQVAGVEHRGFVRIPA